MNPGLNPKVARRDLYLRRGDTFRETLQYTDATTGAPINITSWTFRAQIRASADDATVLASFAFSITDAVNGKVEWSIASTVTALLPTDTTKLGVYDLEHTDASGDITTDTEGSVFLISDVTR